MANDLFINSGVTNYTSTNAYKYTSSDDEVAKVAAVRSLDVVKASPGNSASTVADEQKNENKDIQTFSELKSAEIRGNVSPGEEVVIKAIAKANKALEGRYTSFEFSVHEKTKQISITVKDRDTGEIIREIPPEKALDMVARLWEMAGILVDEKR